MTFWDRRLIPVLTAEQARALDRAAIDAGTESFELMRRAGDRLAHLLLGSVPDLRQRPIQVVVGPGNNGGDGWVAAAVLSNAGCTVRVTGQSPRTDDAAKAKALCPNEIAGVIENPHVVLDAILGTGASGEYRPEIRELIEIIRGAAGAIRVAVDLPSGLDATTGSAAEGCPAADLTVSFGSWKRGQLFRRDLVGELTCLDIGLPPPEPVPVAPDERWVRAVVPEPGALATKSERRRLIIVGGGEGMAGATILSARGAFGSGVGMVRCYVHRTSLGAMNAGAPQATAIRWPDSVPSADDLRWGHAMVIGPGFGIAAAREALLGWLSAFAGPVVVDADALTALVGRLDDFRVARAGRVTLLSPHAAEAGRLLGCGADEVRSDPFTAVTSLAAKAGCAVLLKGVPSLVSDGERTFVVPRGGPVLGVGGSGDLLSGMAGALLAQLGEACTGAVVAASFHGRAAELATGGGPWRGLTLDHVIGSLPAAWAERPAEPAEFVLGRLPRAVPRV